VSYKFTGQLGLAPEWETSACGTDCQENVSACVLAHVNTSGQHVALWLVGSNPALGWGQSSNYPYQEGSFFGNIFVSPPQALYCNGKDFDIGLVPGRLGASSSSVYKNPYASGSTYCKDYCSAQGGDGYKSCGSWKHVITVWRDFDPNVDYKVCNRGNDLCMNIAGSSTADSALIAQNNFNSTNPSMRWRISQVSPGKYKFINARSGKSMDAGPYSADGVQVNQYTYKASSNQLWSFTPTGDGYYKFSPASYPTSSVDVPSWSTSEGTVLQQHSWNAGSNQQWTIVPVN
jgi:hypothetical protein